ncbi:hypothetical protein C1H46_004862 [Malus baccata]|uniref:Uncharacterized protein n=1 Tax=Malus baccata TaxID=106549 RepID=A0A540NEN6_MALBA|nr:hypothetical protein C1H46_004862 [Malus baccata]
MGRKKQKFSSFQDRRNFSNLPPARPVHLSPPRVKPSEVKLSSSTLVNFVFLSFQYYFTYAIFQVRRAVEEPIVLEIQVVSYMTSPKVLPWASQPTSSKVAITTQPPPNTQSSS